MRSRIWCHRTSMYFERLVWPRAFAMSSAAALSLCSGVEAGSLPAVSATRDRSHTVCSPALLLEIYSAAQLLTTTVLIRLEHHEIGVPAQ